MTPSGSRESLRLFGLIIGVTVLVDVIGQWLLTAVFGVGIRPLAVLVLFLTIYLGERARLGLVIGLFLAGGLLNDWSGALSSGLGALVATTICHQLWIDRPRRSSHHRWLLYYGFVSIMTVFGLSAAIAWVSDALGRAPFFVSVSQSVTANLLPVLFAAPIVWLMVSAEVVYKWRTETKMSRWWTKPVVATVLTVWVFGGFIGSFLYQVANLIPGTVFGRRLGSTVELAVNLGGPHGTYAVFVHGAISLGIIAIVLNHMDRESGE